MWSTNTNIPWMSTIVLQCPAITWYSRGKYWRSWCYILRDVADVQEATKEARHGHASLRGGEPVPAVTLSVIKNQEALSLTSSMYDKKNQRTPSQQNHTRWGPCQYHDGFVRADTEWSQWLNERFCYYSGARLWNLFLHRSQGGICTNSTIPIVFLLTFVVLKLAGQTLNFLFFSLVLSLGLPSMMLFW